jgi:hypothetical protein
MPNAEKVYQSPALTQGWENLQDGELFMFDTVNDYAKKYHLDKKNAPSGLMTPRTRSRMLRNAAGTMPAPPFSRTRKIRSWSSSRPTSLAS